MREPAHDASQLDAQSTAKGDASDVADAARDARSDARADSAADTAIAGGDAGANDAATSDAASNDAGAGALDTFVYVGGADWSGSAFPFRSFRLDRESGALSVLQETVDLGLNPSYATPTRDGRFLYVANEDERAAGVTVAALAAADGRASKLEQERFVGSGGALVFTSLDPSEKHVLAADYNGGRVAVYGVASDGTLGAALDTKTFASGAHSHSIRTDPSGKWAYVPNKDANAIAQFAFDEATGKLTELTPATVAAPGGPRHIAFTPDGKFAYVILEYDDKVNAYSVGANGALTQIDSKSSLPTGVAGDQNTGAHVLVHPNGKYVYASNRGHDSIAVFAIAADGKLTLRANTPSQGKIPRNFDIDARGELLVVANQGDGSNNGTLAVFAIRGDGTLEQRGTTLTGLKSPQAVALVNRPR